MLWSMFGAKHRNQQVKTQERRDRACECARELNVERKSTPEHSKPQTVRAQRLREIDARDHIPTQSSENEREKVEKSVRLALFVEFLRNSLVRREREDTHSNILAPFFVVVLIHLPHSA